MGRIKWAVAAAAAVLGLAGCSRETAVQAKPFSIGERVPVGHLTYTVLEANWVTRLPRDPEPRLPQNRFLLVRISVASGMPNDILLPNLTIEDDNGNSFSELDNGDGVPQWAGFLRKARPAEAMQGTIAFDAPARHYRLRVVDENGDAPALIDIPLSIPADPTDAAVPITPGARR